MKRDSVMRRSNRLRPKLKTEKASPVWVQVKDGFHRQDFEHLRELHENREWVWCLHCECVYQWGDFKRENDAGVKCCPIGECDAGVFLDSWAWSHILEAHADYPVVPEYGAHYPLYGAKVSKR